MIPRIDQARCVRDYTIHARFSDGAEGDVDLREELHGGLSEPLSDPKLFRQFCVHAELHGLCWPNGADIAPEFLYEKVWIPA